MEQTYNVLIIDDHQIIVDTYKRALAHVGSIADMHFNISQAKNCDSAYYKIIDASEKQNIDLIFLDIQLLPSTKHKIFSGEDLGIMVKENLPKAKIIVCTCLHDNFRSNNIYKNLNPEGLLIKSDIIFNDLVTAVIDIVSNKNYYSQSVLDFIKKRVIETVNLDDVDMLLLHEMTNGAKMKDLIELMPLSKSGIEKRKKLLKQKFNLIDCGDRDLVLEAKKRGYV